jgi:hypothetical protein
MLTLETCSQEGSLRRETNESLETKSVEIAKRNESQQCLILRDENTPNFAEVWWWGKILMELSLVEI